jgi:hypothetical protein
LNEKTWSVEYIIDQLQKAMTSQKEMEKEYDCDMSNHVSNIVECILMEYNKGDD